MACSRSLDHPARAPIVLTGLLAGLALGVKYPALVLAGLLGLGSSPRPALFAEDDLVADAIGRWRSFADSWPSWWGASGICRAWYFTGNPVYPFFRQVFGGRGSTRCSTRSARPMAVTPGTS